MALEFIQVYTRPNVSVPWFHETWSQSHMEYIDNKYKKTGKFTGSRLESEDKLMIILSYSFVDENAYIEWMQDEYLQEMAKTRISHDSKYGIKLHE